MDVRDVRERAAHGGQYTRGSLRFGGSPRDWLRSTRIRTDRPPEYRTAARRSRCNPFGSRACQLARSRWHRCCGS